MKKALLTKLMLLLFALIAGSSSVWAGDETITIDFESNEIPTGWTNYNSMVVVDNPISSSSATHGSHSLSTNGKQNCSLTSGKIDNVKSISIDATKTSTNTATNLYIDFSTKSDFSSDVQTLNVTTIPKNSWATSTLTLTAKANGYVRIRWAGTSTATKFIDNIVITTNADQEDTRTATTVVISNNDTEGIYQNASAKTPTATVKAGGTTVETTVTWTSSNEDVATIVEGTGIITLVGPGTTTIKAAYAGDVTYKPSNATYTLTVYGICTTMAELQACCAAYGNNSMKGKMTFNNVYVTAVKGNNAYISDGTNGAVIYKSSHGFVAGDKLASTALEMTMMNYNGYTPEITSLTSSTNGLTVTNGQTITPTTLAVNAITTANFGTLVKITNVIYDATNKVFKDASNNTIAYYDNFTANPTLNDGEEYDVTGVILFKNSTTVEICPRAASDVVAKAVKTTPTSNWKVGDNVVTSIAVTKGGTVSATFETNSTGTKSFASSQESVATVSNKA